jgi:hypothetical protein
MWASIALVIALVRRTETNRGPQQFVIGGHGTLRVAQTRGEGIVVGPDESQEDLSLQPRGRIPAKGFRASIR